MNSAPPLLAGNNRRVRITGETQGGQSASTLGLATTDYAALQQGFKCCFGGSFIRRMGSIYFPSRDDWDFCGQIRKISATNTWIAFTCHQIVYIARVPDKLLRVWEFQTDQDGEQARQEQAEGPGLPLHRQEHRLPHQWCKEKSVACCSHLKNSIYLNWFALF